MAARRQIARQRLAVAQDLLRGLVDEHPHPAILHVVGSVADDFDRRGCALPAAGSLTCEPDVQITDVQKDHHEPTDRRHARAALQTNLFARRGVDDDGA